MHRPHKPLFLGRVVGVRSLFFHTHSYFDMLFSEHSMASNEEPARKTEMTILL